VIIRFIATNAGQDTFCQEQVLQPNVQNALILVPLVSTHQTTAKHALQVTQEKDGIASITTTSSLVSSLLVTSPH